MAEAACANQPYDIFILAGQSNAEGYGIGPTEHPYIPCDEILMMRDTYGVSFKKDEHGEYHLPIKLVHYAAGEVMFFEE